MHRTVDVTTLPPQRTSRGRLGTTTGQQSVVLDLDLLPVIDVPPAAPAPDLLELVLAPEQEAAPALRPRRRASRSPLHRRRSVQLATTAVLALAVGAGGATVVERARTAGALEQSAGAQEELRTASALAATQLAGAEAAAATATEAQARAEAERAALDADLTATTAELEAVQAELDELLAAGTRRAATASPSASASSSASAGPAASSAPRASAPAASAAPRASGSASAAPAAPAPAPTAAPAPSAAPAQDDGGSATTSYDTCGDARAAGAAPVRAGDPGYGSHLDRDGDGVGCE
jgi:hypothetical protein